MKPRALTIMAGVISGFMTIAVLPLAAHADGNAILQSQCSSCHNIDTPEVNNPARSERLLRQAPPLHFAGNKYREEWLQQWLTDPSPIHPAGYFPNRHIVNNGSGDEPAPDAPFNHPALSAADASAVSQSLMQLRSRDELIAADGYEPGSVAMRMGMMDFRRFKGCDACHQDSPDAGGLSGPVLHNAASRLQPAYLSSFIQNPVAWDHNTVMPVLTMNETAVHKLVHYLLMLGEQP